MNGKIKVKIKTTSTWNYCSRKQERIIEIQTFSKIYELINILGLPNDDIGLIIKNNKRAKREDIVQNGDIVEFYPLAGGG